jgi:beta-glucosidase
MNLKPLLFLIAILGMTHSAIYQKYYDEAYRIAVAMTLDQKIGQTMQVDFGAFSAKNRTDENEAVKLHLGSLLVGGDGMPDANGNMVEIPQKEDDDRKLYATATSAKWQKLASRFNYSIVVTTSEGKRYDIRPLLGTDAVHGNQHVSGAILFPHNVGLACSHNPDNFFNSARWAALSVKRSGFNYAFSPTVAVSHNPQWGRFYETIGQEEDYIYQYAKAYTLGLQGTPGNWTGVLGSVKHFYADGATIYGAD